MNVLASERFGQYYLLRLSLRKSAKIVYGNVLRMDWNDMLTKDRCSYILSNPPFVGTKYQAPEQRADLQLVFGRTPNAELLDYVGCWYLKAAESAYKRQLCPPAPITHNSPKRYHLTKFWCKINFWVVAAASEAQKLKCFERLYG